ncbi:MAG: hypothetical protein JWP11_2846 [Frankiales bacterium]|nr:hypothetical protein [Frankiales bacterium]
MKLPFLHPAPALDDQDVDEITTLVESAIEALSCALTVVTPGVATQAVAARRSRLMRLAQKLDRIRRQDSR